jgi:putative tryptophan/tyrosine transport system substrate-binding protein
MRRREFIALLGGAAAWPVMAGAQQAERMRRIGVLMNITADDPDARANNAAFLQVLQQLGWVDGRNVRIDTRWASGDAAQLRKYAAELAATAPDVIFASGTAAMGALSHATRTVPIVFNVVADPVGAGYVDSLARPGGNATGFMEFEYSLSAKWVELLKQIAPGVRRAAILRIQPYPPGSRVSASMRSISASTSAISFRAAGESVTLGCCAHTAALPSVASTVMAGAAIQAFIWRDLVSRNIIPAMGPIGAPLRLRGQVV